MKNFLTLLTCLIIFSSSNAQSAYRTFSGRVIDSTTMSPLGDATVSIFRASDTLLLNFGFTTPLGNFSLIAKTSDSLMIVFSLLGYNDFVVREPIEEGWNFKTFGDIKLSLAPKEFKAHTFRMSAIRMRGDTIEINANRFKVLPGSDVAQLFKKIPGFEVNVKGEIKVNGSEVSKIMVDGSDFFGNNPAMVSKNLNADMIETVQVFDDKNDDGSPKESAPKIINLKLKKGKRNGLFGDFMAGYGTENRHEAGIRLNSFKNDRKLSVIINKNNINGTGFDFGFSNWHSVDDLSRNGSGNDNENWIYNDYYNNQDGNINNRTDGGFTYFNEFPKKRKLSINLDFSHNKYLSISSSNSLFSINDSSNRRSLDSNYMSGVNDRVGGSVNYTKQFDSTGYFEIGGSVSHNVNTNQTESFNTVEFNDIQANKGIGDIRNNTTGDNANLNISIRRSLRKDRRYVFSAFNSNKFNIISSENKQFQENASDTFNLLKTLDNSSMEWLSKLYLRAPIYKRNIFVNISADRWQQTNTNVQRTVGALNPYSRTFEQSYTNAVDTLSIEFDNTQVQYSLKPYISFEYKYLYAMTGFTMMYFNLKNENISEKSSISKNYERFLPFIYVSYYPNGKGWFNLNLNKSTNFPTISDLQPVLNLNNNYERKIGNENLEPIDYYNLRLYGNFQKLRGFRFLYTSLYGNFSDNAKVWSQTQNEDGVLISTPINTSGLRNLNGYFGTSKKITKAINFGLGLSADMSQNPIIVNGLKSFTNNNGLSIRPNLNFSYSDSLEMDFNMGWHQTNYRNNLNSNLNYNQNIFSYGWSMRTILHSGTEINTSLDVQDNRNVPGIGRLIPVWSAYIQQPIGKTNFNLKFSAYDILKQNTSISRTAMDNFIIINRSNQLQQYFMLTLIYKIKKMGGEDEGEFVF